MKTPAELEARTQQVIDWFATHGPHRSTALRKQIPGGSDILVHLSNMFHRGQLDRRHDGFHQGKVVYVWGIPGAFSSPVAPANRFQAAEILAAFQAAALGYLMAAQVQP